MADELADLRRTVYRMRYWVLPITGLALVVNAVAIARHGDWGLLPADLFSAGAIGVAWTTTGWLKP